MKKLLSFFIAAVVVYQACSPANAAGIESSGIDPQGRIMSVKGVLPVPKPQQVTLMVINNGKSFEAFSGKVTDTFNHFEQTMSDRLGNFQFSFKIASETKPGNLQIYVGCEGVEIPYLTTVFYYSEEIRNQIISDIIASDDLNVIRTLLSDKVNLDVLGLDSELLSGIKEESGKAYVWEKIANLQAGDTGQDLTDAFYRAVIYTGFKENISSSFIGRVADKGLGAYIGLDHEMSSYYNDLLAEDKKDLYDKLGNGFPGSIEEAASRLSAHIACNSFINHRYGAVLKMLEVFKEKGIIAIDLSELGHISNRDDVYKAMAGKRYASPALIEKSYEAAVDAAKKAEGPDKTPYRGGGGGFSISPPATAVPVPGATAEDALPPVAYNDLQGFEWAQKAIQYLSDKKVVNGYSDGSFQPQGNITREEFVKIAVCAFNLYDANASARFSDVGKDAWYYGYVASAYNKGIINGLQEGAFGTGNYITREDVAVILYRLLNKSGVILKEERDMINFEDGESISMYAKDAVEFLYKCKIINGFEGKGFLPKQNATRAEAAKMVYELSLLSGVEIWY